MPEGDLSAIRAVIIGLMESAQGIGVMQMDASAGELWAAVYPELTRDHPGLAGAIINRGEVQALRLAMLYALLDGRHAIGEAHLRAALAFWSYCRDSALCIFGGREADPVTEKVFAALRAGPKTTTELHEALGRNCPAPRLREILEGLTAQGKVTSGKEKADGNGRRPRTVFTLNELNEITKLSAPEVGSKFVNSLISSRRETISAPDDPTAPWSGPAEVVL
jgi:hypothetical protein